MTTELDQAIEQTAAAPKDLATVLAAKKYPPQPVSWGSMWSFDEDNPSRPKPEDYGDLKEFANGKPGKGESSGTTGHFAQGWDCTRSPMLIYPLDQQKAARALAARDQWLADLPEADRQIMESIIGDAKPEYGVIFGNRRFRALPHAYIAWSKEGKDRDALTPVASRLKQLLSPTDIELLSFADNLQPTPGARRPTSAAQIRMCVKMYQQSVTEARMEPVFGSRFRAQQMMAVARLVVQGPRSGAPWKDADDFLRRIELPKDDAEHIDTSNLLAGKNKEDLRKASLALEDKGQMGGKKNKKRPTKDRMSLSDAMDIVRTVIVERRDVVAQRGLSKTEWEQLASRNASDLFFRFCYEYVCSKTDDRTAFYDFIVAHRDELNAVFADAAGLYPKEVE